MSLNTRVIGGSSGNPRTVGGAPFRPDAIKSLLQNPIYIGKVRCQGEVFPGRHEPLVSEETWERANALLARQPPSPSRPGRDRHVHLLKGLIRCADCGSTMTPYPSGRVGPDGEQYLYYVCTAVLRDQRGCPCRVRRLPVRRFERAVIRLLSSLAESPDLLRGHLKTSEIADGKELGALSSRRDELLASQDDIECRLTRLVSHFGEDDVPVFVGEEIRRLDARREDIRNELAELEGRIDELRAGTASGEELRRRLAALSEGCERPSLEERKELVQGIVGRIEVDRWEPPTSADCTSNPKTRTRRLLVNISLRSPTSRASRRIRTCAVIPCWGDLDSSWVAAEFVLHHGVPPETPPGAITVPETTPRETPEQRALRFQGMLESGEVSSRAELARRLGVSPSAITKALRRLPGDHPQGRKC